MDRQGNTAIIILLGLILAVLLFGKSVVLQAFTIVPVVLVIGIVLAVLYWLLGSGLRIAGGFLQDNRKTRAEGGPWIAQIILGLVVPCYVCYILPGTAFMWLAYGGNLKDAMTALPGWPIPLILMAGGLAVMAVETRKQWCPRVLPTAMIAIPKAFMWWGSLLSAPFWAPIGRMQGIKERRLAGEQVGVFQVGLEMFLAVFGGVIIFMLGLAVTGMVLAGVIGGLTSWWSGL
ncbi:hypothetical protein [Aestuariivirga litoralis]|uniref:hypothetical protein n=1 Tax=Aestuariivirga litoralis TaxID=2650924 RepID=UPI0018C5A62F|nr:hypothetical protein [Aestuariivirga litoralis]MBG1230896.1 hypothetical protein [Aestuariivirga litoralis]